MAESARGEVKPSRSSWNDAPLFNPTPNTTPNRPLVPSDWAITALRGAKPLINPNSTPASPVISWSSLSESTSNENPFSLETIATEIDNEFRHMKGEPIYTFGRQPTPGLESIRNAIHKHTRALIDRIKSLEADRENEENRKALAKKKIREAILDGRNGALECRVRILENLLVEYLPLA